MAQVRVRASVHPAARNDDSQLDDLTAYGCDKIFTDKTSGKLAERPELDKALAYLRAGDVLVITRLSRAMRSLKHLLVLADELRERGVDPPARAWPSCTGLRARPGQTCKTCCSMASGTCCTSSGTATSTPTGTKGYWRWYARTGARTWWRRTGWSTCCARPGRCRAWSC